MLLVAAMRKIIRFGTVSLLDTEGNRYQISNFGSPVVTLRLASSAAARRLIFATSMGWCEAYMDGNLLIEEGTLDGFLEAWGRSEVHLNQSWYGELVRRVYSLTSVFAHYNPMDRSRRNVAHHYDLSAELYDQFLDSDRQYSCAYFPNGDEDIDTA